MKLLSQVKTLIYKDILLEWRSKHAINGILLYVVSTVFVCYQSFKSVDTLVWNTLYWIILLFAAVNAISRCFIQETGSRQLYYYNLIDPRAIILAKIIYNSLLMLILSGTAFLIYALIFQNQAANTGAYLLAIFLGSMSFATVFTMVAGISAKAGNNSTIMAILSFPVVIPLLIVLIQLSQQAVAGEALTESWGDVGVLLAINIVTIAISLLLFPYLWRD